MVWNTKLQPLVLSIALICIATALFGQSEAYQAKHFNHRKGLPAHIVFDVLQDTTGLIWLTTENGLIRFDGYEFMPFHNFQYSRAIEGDEFIIDVTKNQSGELAIVHGQKELSFELFNLETYQGWSPDFKEFPGKPIAIFTKKKGHTYFLVEDNSALIIYKLTADRSFEVIFQTSLLALEQEQTVNLFVDQTNSFWIGLEKGLHLFDSQGQLVKSFGQSDFNSEGAAVKTLFLHEDQKGIIRTAIKNEKGIYEYDSATQSFHRNLLIGDSDYFSQIWEDKKGNLLFKGSRHEMSAYITDLVCLLPSGKLKSFSYVKNITESIIDIYSQDFEEMLLIGAANGLNVINQAPSSFHTILDKKLTAGGWGRSIRGITGDQQGNIYIGTETNELFQYNSLKDSLFELPLKNIYKPKNRKYFGGRTIYLDNQEYIWSISSNNEKESYLHRFDLKTQETVTTVIEGLVTNFRYDGDRFFYFVIQDKIGDHARLMRFDKKTRFVKKWTDKEGLNPVLGKNGRSISGIDNDILWIGTTDGLVKIDLKNQQSKEIFLENKDKERYESQEIVAITETPDALWLGTAKGFVRWDKRKEIITEAYRDEDGLVSNTVCGILPDAAGNIWLSTFNGLSYFNKETNLFNNFYPEDGLSHYEFNRMAFYQDYQGKYFFGGMNGINIFDTKTVLQGNADNQLVLTKLLKNFTDSDSQMVQLAGFDKLTALTLSPKVSQFEFHFTMPNYLSKEIKYSAWLENYEEDWNFLGDNPKVRYSKLPAGDYVMHIKAADDKGNLAQNELKIPIVVQEVFYKKAWFQLLMMGLIGLLLVGISQYHANQELKVERLRTKLSSDLHDEVSGLLAGIAMQTDLMQMLTKEEENKERLIKIGETSRSAMSKMGDVIWSVDARKDKFSDLLQRMQEHAAEILQPLGIQYNFEIGDFNKNKKMDLKLRQNLYLIFKETINNIAKHSTASIANITLKNMGDLFYLTVKDNGQAKEKAANYKTGQGLSNLKMRTEEIKGELAILRENGYEVLLKVKRFA